jgi:hypothetical protein
MLYRKYDYYLLGVKAHKGSKLDTGQLELKVDLLLLADHLHVSYVLGCTNAEEDTK